MGQALVESRQNLELVESAMSGDRHAVERLLAIARPDIRRFARRHCRTSSDVDDAVQEALWVLYRRIGMLRAAGALSSWLFTVVRHACLKMAGSIFQKTLEIEEYGNDPRLSSVPMADLRIDVAAAIASLPPQYREIVILRDLQEMTINEIGDELNLGREAVKGRLNRARSLLREYLIEEKEAWK
jgi:RNA polymerase sigma-70 factor (ECF subfamily)